MYLAILIVYNVTQMKYFSDFIWNIIITIYQFLEIHCWWWLRLATGHQHQHQHHISFNDYKTHHLNASNRESVE